jgi:hypothetical protein
MLNHNDLFEALIRVGNEPSQVFDIIQRLDLHQPEGYMLYEETSIPHAARSFLVILPMYEFRACCPVHPPHDYDFDNPLDVGSRRHVIWRNTQAHEKAKTRHRERLIMGIVNSEGET